MAKQNERVALVTGAGGYVGTRLCRALIQKGWKVVGLVRNKLPDTDFYFLKDPGTQEHTTELFRKVSPQLVFHLAAHVTPSWDDESAKAIFASNMGLGFRILEAMRASGCTRMINIGTFWEFNSKGEVEPNTLYAGSKAAFRMLVDLYCNRVSFSALHLILYEVLGPRDPRNKFLKEFFEGYRLGHAVAATEGNQKVFVTFIEDVISALLLAGERALVLPEGRSELYGVRPDTAITLRELFDHVVALLPGAKRPLWGEKPYPPHQVFEPAVLTPLTGWKPSLGLSEGLQKLVKEEFVTSPKTLPDAKDPFQEHVVELLRRYKRTQPSDPLVCIPVLDAEQTTVGFLRPICRDFRVSDPTLPQLLTRWRQQNPDVGTGTFEVTTERTLYWLDRHIVDRQDRILFMLLSLDQKPTGHMGLSNFNFAQCSAEVDCVLQGEAKAPESLMNLGLQALIRWARDEVKVKRLYLSTFSDNKNAISFFEQNGFVGQGLKGLYRVQLQGESKLELAPANYDGPIERYFLSMQYQELQG